MKLTFESNLEYQLLAINSVVNLFEGQTPLEKEEFTFINGEDNKAQLFAEIIGIRNNLTISE